MNKRERFGIAQLRLEARLIQLVFVILVHIKFWCSIVVLLYRGGGGVIM